MNSIFDNTLVSLFDKAKFSGQRRHLHKPLIDVLTSNHFETQTLAYRNTQFASDEDKQLYKASNLWAFTASGMFEGTNKASNLITHSGFIALDIDFKDNPYTAESIRDELAKLKQVAYSGLSVGGKGVFVLVPLAYPDKHKQHFESLSKFFADKIGLQLDKACSDISRLRFCSYDADCYINHNAKPYADLPAPPKVYKARRSGTGTGTAGSIQVILDRVQNLIESAQDGNRNNTLVKAGRLLGGYVPQYISEYEADSFLCDLVDSWGNIAKDKKVIRTSLEYGKQYPLTLSENPTQFDTHPLKETNQERTQSDTIKRTIPHTVKSAETYTVKKNHQEQPPPANSPLDNLLTTFDATLEPIPDEWQTNDFKPCLSDVYVKEYDDKAESEIIMLKGFFSAITAYPDNIIMLSAGEVVTDIAKCVNRALSCMSESSGAVQRTYVDRLKAIKREIELHQLAEVI